MHQGGPRPAYNLPLAALLFLFYRTCWGSYIGPSGSTPLVPWLQPPAWKPLYEGLHKSLPDMLKSRVSQDNYVSVFPFSIPANRTRTPDTDAFTRMTLNALFTYRVFGQGSSDIVACLSPAALEECLKFRLPCLDATSYAKDLSYKEIGWAKVKVVCDVLKLGFNVHLSDLDLSYVKPLGPAIHEVFSWSNGAADGSMMTEHWVHQDDPANPGTRRTIYIGNIGMIFLKANERSIKFLSSLLSYAGSQWQDQYIATFVAYQSWAPCTDEATCLAVRGRGMAAIHLHPSQFAHSNCVPEPNFSLCSPRRLYVHAVCRATSRDKAAFLRDMKTMFIAENTEGSDDPAVVGRQDNAALAAAGLPCAPAQQRAWKGHAPSFGSSGSGEAAGEGDGSGSGSSGTVRIRRQLLRG